MGNRISQKQKHRGVRKSNTPARFVYKTCGVHTCKYLVNWRNYTERDLNLKWPNWESFDILKLIFFACTIRKGQPYFDWYLKLLKQEMRE